MVNLFVVVYWKFEEDVVFFFFKVDKNEKLIYVDICKVCWVLIYCIS